MNVTSITDSHPRPVSINPDRFTATAVSGLIPIAHLANRLGLLQPALDYLGKAYPAKHNTLVSAQAMFKQRLFGLVAGYEDLNDHDSLCNDPGFKASLGSARMAGGSNLCRFENRFTREDVDGMNQTLLDAFSIANSRLQLLPKVSPGKKRFIYLDVDSTHVDLYGNQEKKSYNGHYQCCCLAPVVCYLHGYPIAVYGAAGTSDARKVLEHHFVRLHQRLVAMFPDYIIALRGDAGFNSIPLLDYCGRHRAPYITGLAPNKVSKKRKIRNQKRQTVKRFTADGTAVKITGNIDYRAKTWTNDRRVVARKLFDKQRSQMDLRLIQTNIVHTTDINNPGYFGALSAKTDDDLYSVAYCGRGNAERWIGEFKTDCFGARASAKKFTTNCYRFVLAMYCQLLLKVARFAQMARLRSHGKAKKPVNETTARLVRRDVICVTAKYHETAEGIELTLPAHLHDETGYMAMIEVGRIAMA